jgi:hypothetical protein
MRTDLTRTVARWRRLGATRLVLLPGARELPLVADTRAEAVAEIVGAEVDTVEAYKDIALVGVWRRPVEMSPPATAADSTAATFATMVGFLREMMGLQVASLRSVREAMDAAASMRPLPALLRDDEDDEKDGQAERDGALLAALMRAAPATTPNGDPTTGAPK